MNQSTLQPTSTAALSAARRFHQQLQANAHTAWQRDSWQQGGTIALAIAATLLAVLPTIPASHPDWLVQVSRVGLVLLGLTSLSLVGISSRLQAHQNWLTLAAGAAAVERAMYLYRTLLQYTPDRNLWLNQQLAEIQQQVQERLGGAWILQPGELVASEIDLNGDHSDLLADDYLKHRLIPQLEQSNRQVTQLTRTRNWLRLALLGCAGLIVLAPFGGLNGLGWGAIASTSVLGVLLWLKMTQFDPWLSIHSELGLGLTLLHDYWQSLPTSERTGQKFFHLVIAAETLSTSPYRQMTDQIRETVEIIQGKKSDLVHQILTQPTPPALEQALRAVPTLPEKPPLESVVSPIVQVLPPITVEASSASDTPDPSSPINGKTAGSNGKTSENKIETVIEVVKTITQVVPARPPATKPAPKRGRPHSFVVMPFGRKQAPDGRWIDFNAIYQDLIKPAIEEAGFESFRADEEGSSGDILTDMFQELLLAELVVADLSIDNANVFYELGIRHAMRRRGVVHIQAGRAYMPFDIFNVRTLPYHCDQSGRPDPQFIDKDKQALVKMIQATWATERNRVHSPVFNLLTGLIEPDRKTLRTPLARGYWQEYTTLQNRIAIAQRQKRIGDVVLLAEEVNNPLIKEEILGESGKALKTMGNSALALKEYRQGLKINPENVTFRCEEAYHLSRLNQTDEAIVKLEQLLLDVPTCVDATAYLARIYKDLWKQNWVAIADEQTRIQAAYESSFLLQKSIENYVRGYRIDQNQYYPGINALTLTALLDHLANVFDWDNGDKDEATYRHMLSALKGSVKFCLESAHQKLPNDPWVALSLGDLAICIAESPTHVATAYRKALAILWNNKFALKAAIDQLKLMNQLNFRPEFVHTGMMVLQTELERIERQEQVFTTSSQDEEGEKPSKVFLFTGHMIDRPNRPKPRFPAAMEAEATQRLEEVLNKLEANDHCIAIIGGLACGGDIIFAEICLKRNIRVEIYLPFEPSEFIQDSVSFAGDSWVERFYTAINHPNVTHHIQPDRLGAVPAGDTPYERNNRWALYSTLMYDVRRVRLVVLWDGQGGDGPGGTADMVQQVRQLGGMVEHLDTTKFDYWRSQVPVIKQILQKL